MANPNSGRSDRRGYRLEVLPSTPYAGRIPAFPLSKPSAAEREVWAEIWRTPQAHVWAAPGQGWRHRAVAMWVRLSVRCEADDAPASLLNQLNHMAHEVGLTSRGLAAMGYRIALPEPERPPAPRRVAKHPRDRIRLAPEFTRTPKEKAT